MISRSVSTIGRFSLKGAALGLAVVLGSATAAPARTGQPWWNAAWKVRRQATPFDAGGGYPKVAYLKFFDMGHARRDGGDFRVVDDRGATLPHKIMLHHEGVATVIAFPLQRRGQRIWVYFGNPKARASRSDWEPEAGLFLETRQYDGRPVPNNMAQMRKLLDRFPEPYGGDYRGQIFDAYNPFGSSEDFISIFTGYVRVRESRRYRFATLSDDASFFLVNGKMVCQWPGRHGPHAGRRGQFRGAIELSKGIHKIEYYHTDTGDGQVMELAWIDPDEGRRGLEVVPPEFFVPILASREGDLEQEGGEPIVDLLVTPSRSATLEGVAGEFIECQFVNRVKIDPRQVADVSWDFGDGVSSTEKSPNHVYVRRAVFEVRLTLNLRNGRRLEGSQKVLVSDRDDISVADDLFKAHELAKQIALYPFDRMPTQDLEALLPLLRERRFLRECVEAGKALLDDKKGTRPEIVETLVEILTDDMNEPEQARELLTDALKKIGRKRPRAIPILLQLGRLDLEFRRNGQMALKSANQAEELAREAKNRRAHWQAAVLVGDCHRAMGHYEEAREAYRRAERIESPGATAGLRRSSYGLTVESYLESREFDAAREMLEQWEREYPTERLFGYSSLLWARYHVLNNNVKEAIGLLDIIHRANPDGPHARDIANFLATLLMRQNEYERAIAVLEPLKDRYDDEAFSRSVEERIQTCRQRMRQR